MPDNTSIIMTTTQHRGVTVAALFLSLCSLIANANESVLNSIERRSDQLTDLSDLIWDLAEVGYQETRSSAALKSALEAEGFTIESGVAEIPTAFIASYGSGEPVIAVSKSD
jgi:aminobenzoyl-glutamate utilization protein B